MNVNTHKVNILTKRKTGKGTLFNDAPVCHPVFTSPFNVFHGEQGIFLYGAYRRRQGVFYITHRRHVAINVTRAGGECGYLDQGSAE